MRCQEEQSVLFSSRLPFQIIAENEGGVLGRIDFNIGYFRMSGGLEAESFS